MVTYASLIWARVCRLGTKCETLKRVQRQALKMLTFVRHRTPTIGLLTGTCPLDIYICGYAAMAYIRTRGFEKHSRQEMSTEIEGLKGHRQIMDEWLVTMDLMELDGPTDTIP